MSAASPWHGFPILAVDIIVFGAMLVGMRLNAFRSVLAGSVPAFALGGPLIHLFHGYELQALASIGFRALLPPALGFAAVHIANALVLPRGNTGKTEKLLDWGGIATMTGLLLASGIDVVTLSGYVSHAAGSSVFVLLGTAGVMLAASRPGRRNHGACVANPALRSRATDGTRSA